jgi:hypothetical protein
MIDKELLSYNVLSPVVSFPVWMSAELLTYLLRGAIVLVELWPLHT